MPATAEEDATLECGATDRRSTLGVRGTRLGVGDDLDPREQAQPADLTDARVVREGGRQVREHALAERGRAADEPFVAHHADRGAAGGEVDRVAHERRRVGAGRPVAHERSTADDRGDGEPAADPLADGHQVRNDARMLAGPHPAGSAESRLDLVEYEDDAVAVAQLAQPLEEAVRRDDDAAVALDGLDDDRRDGAEPGRRVLEGMPDEGERAIT